MGDPAIDNMRLGHPATQRSETTPDLGNHAPRGYASLNEIFGLVLRKA